MITQERLKELVHYDPETGIMTNLVKRGGLHVGAKLGGSSKSTGYLNCQLDGTEYTLGRLAFLYMLGAFPVYEVDHKNRVKTDNRWCNLRDITHTENCRNLDRNLAHIGVRWRGDRSCWQTYSGSKENRVYLGHYKKYKEACEAVDDYENKGSYRGVFNTFEQAVKVVEELEKE